MFVFALPKESVFSVKESRSTDCQLLVQSLPEVVSHNKQLLGSNRSAVIWDDIRRGAVDVFAWLEKHERIFDGETAINRSVIYWTTATDLRCS